MMQNSSVVEERSDDSSHVCELSSFIKDVISKHSVSFTQGHCFKQLHTKETYFILLLVATVHGGCEKSVLNKEKTDLILQFLFSVVRSQDTHCLEMFYLIQAWLITLRRTATPDAGNVCPEGQMWPLDNLHPAPKCLN